MSRYVKSGFAGIRYLLPDVLHQRAAFSLAAQIPQEELSAFGNAQARSTQPIP